MVPFVLPTFMLLPAGFVGALKGAWLVLLLRGFSGKLLAQSVPPECAEDFAMEHDDAVRKCLSQILGCDVPDTSWDVAELPFSNGSLGLRSARRESNPRAGTAQAE